MKGIAPLVGIAILAVVIIVGGLLATPGAISSITFALTGIAPTCQEDQFFSDCTCTSEEEKLLAFSGVSQRWACEANAKDFDPEASDFEQQAINYAEAKLIEHFPECNMNTCSQGTWELTFGWSLPDGLPFRLVNLECRSYAETYSRAEFKIVNGDIESLYCFDFQGVPQGEPEIDLYYKGAFPIDVIGYRTECFGSGQAVGSYTYELPETKSDSTDWWLLGLNGKANTVTIRPSGTCTITDEQARSFTLECTLDCDGTYGGISGEVSFQRSTQ